jgi:hypothetical protein
MVVVTIMIIILMMVMYLCGDKSFNDGNDNSDTNYGEASRMLAYVYLCNIYIRIQGRVNSNQQDFRHECRREGGRSKCHICDTTVICTSDTGTYMCIYDYMNI